MTTPYHDNLRDEQEDDDYAEQDVSEIHTITLW